MALIELKGAGVVLEGLRIFESLDFALRAGQSAAICGENGAGKTTFLRLLSGDLWPVRAESRLYGFTEQLTWSPLRARELIAFVSPLAQEKAVRLAQDGADGERGARLSVRESLTTGLFDSFLLHQKPDDEQQAQVEAMLERFDLKFLAGRDLQTLSQGQLRRVLLARALVKTPRVVLLDEAASGLDAPSRRELFAALETLAESGATFVFASHRREELPPWATRWTIKNGRIERDATRAEEPSTLASSSPALVIPGGGGEEFPSTGSIAERQPPFAAVATGPDRATEPRGCPWDESQTQPPLFQLRGVSVFLDGAPILRDLNWSWPRGTHWRITGENGSGKTTFLRLLGGELAPAHGGEIVRLGETNRPIWEWRRRIALVSPQLQARFHDAISVRDAVASGFEGGFVPPRQLDAAQQIALERALDEWKLRTLEARRFDRLSYGQTRRVLLTRALVASPEVVLLDEALDGLDAATRDFCFALWEQLAQRGTHFAFTSHHEEDFPAWTNAQLEIEAGTLNTSSD